MSLDLSILGIGGPKSARPVVIGDTLSFNAQPDREEDLIECVINWTQDWKPRSEKYMVFKATNVTAGDTKPLVSVFVQSSYYEKRFGGKPDEILQFEVTEEWQYGQIDKTGAGRFVVLHNHDYKPYQHRFVANLLVRLDDLVHDALCAIGHKDIADKLDDITLTYFGEYLLSFGGVVTQSGDILLIPSKPKLYNFDSLRTITWYRNFARHQEEYYAFTVPNQSQKGQDVLFFIQKDWWDEGSTSEHHISKVAPKNRNGQYEFKVDSKAQYGQFNKSGQNRWVVYHDKKRQPAQHCFVDSLLNVVRGFIPTRPLQNQFTAWLFGLKVNRDLGRVVTFVENQFVEYLETFPQTP